MPSPISRLLRPPEVPEGLAFPVYQALRDLRCDGCHQVIAAHSHLSRTADRTGLQPGLRFALCPTCRPLPHLASSVTEDEVQGDEAQVYEIVVEDRSSEEATGTAHTAQMERLAPPEELPFPQGNLVLHVASSLINGHAAWGAVLVADDTEHLTVSGVLTGTPRGIRGALLAASRWYTERQHQSGWPRLMALSCNSTQLSKKQPLPLAAPLLFTPTEHPAIKRVVAVAHMAAKAHEQESANVPVPVDFPALEVNTSVGPVAGSLQPARPVAGPSSADILVFVDYSGSSTRGAHTWGATFLDLRTGQEIEASGPLRDGSEAEAIQAALQWLSVALPGRLATVYNDGQGQHKEALAQGVDVRFLPRTAPGIRRAHTLAQALHLALLRCHGWLPTTAAQE